MAACVPTYMLASSLIDEGMNWWQAVLTIVLANIIVPGADDSERPRGTKYGIPFPVYCRAAFGIRGANVPALLRALVACGWFGIQRWIGGWALQDPRSVLPSWKEPPAHSYFGINLPQFLCFLFFWAINSFVIYRGIDSIRLLIEIKAPLLIVLGLALLAWAYAKRGLRADAGSALAVRGGGPKAAGSGGFLPGADRQRRELGDLSLNIPDFTRYASSQRDQALGQASRCPCHGPFLVHRRGGDVGHIVIFGKAIWDPVELVARFDAPSCTSWPCQAWFWRRWPPTSLPTWSARPTTSPISGPGASPSAPAGSSPASSASSCSRGSWSPILPCTSSSG
jgi:NCS1 family nucleobase:cation symporter-1